MGKKNNTIHPIFPYGTHRKRSRGITSERMNGEGLMGLNNVHLKLKINGAAARQRDAASDAADRLKKNKIHFLSIV